MEEERKTIKVGIYYSYNGEGKRRKMDKDIMREELEAGMRKEEGRLNGDICPSCDDYLGSVGSYKCEKLHEEFKSKFPV